MIKHYLKTSIVGYQKHNWYVGVFQKRYCTYGIFSRIYFKYCLIAISGVFPNCWKTFWKIWDKDPLVCLTDNDTLKYA